MRTRICLSTSSLLVLIALMPAFTQSGLEKTKRLQATWHGTGENKWFWTGWFNRKPTTQQPPFTRLTCDCSCGERNEAGRIVGGAPTESNEYPWMVRLSYLNRFYCGGMLLNDRYVITAAHCVKGFMWFLIKVTLGEHDRCNSTRKPETRFVIRAIVGDFSYLNFNNDIALLRLNDRVPFTETIRPICLPSATDTDYSGVNGTVSGWGTLREDGKTSCVLQEVQVPVMSNEECRTNTSYSDRLISDNMMCAGYHEGLKDSCQGDSGGPLVKERDDRRMELIGIVSWGNGCARRGYPGIYTRVTKYIPWILDNSKEGCFCQQ